MNPISPGRLFTIILAGGALCLEACTGTAALPTPAWDAGGGDVGQGDVGGGERDAGGRDGRGRANGEEADGGESNGGDGAPGRDANEVDAILRALAAADCASNAACVHGVHPEVRRMRNNLLSGRVTVDDDTLRACLAAEAVDDMDFGHLFDSRPTGTVPRACVDLWVPHSAVGAPCDTDFACIDGFCDRGDFFRDEPDWVVQACGVCKPRSDLGGPCSGHAWAAGDAECRRGLRCGGDACVMPGVPPAGLPDGATCDANTDTCAGGFCMPSGRCGAYAVGDTCRQDWMCRGAAYCDAGICRPTSEGSYCWPYAVGVCPRDLVCFDNRNSVLDAGIVHLGRCLARLSAGDPCTQGRPDLCPLELRCSVERERPTCVQDLAVGEPCVADDDTACVPASSCLDGVCVPTGPPPPESEFCLLEPK
jgi:hypothetical protein